MSEISFKPVGVVHSEHAVPANTPAQPVFASDCIGTVEVFPEYADGLKDIEGFSHLYLVYHLHRAQPAKLIVEPILKSSQHGIFATRKPCRPNAIGLSVVELVVRDKNLLHIKGVDILNGTPVLDIKPYSARFDHIVATRSGWLEEVDDTTAMIRGKRQYAVK